MKSEPTHVGISGEAPHVPAPDRDDGLDWYDLVVAQSFPASDPPPLCTGVSRGEATT